MSDIETLVKEEVEALAEEIKASVEDPKQAYAAQMMVYDLSLIPIRQSRGEDVQPIIDSLKAEAAMRTLAFTLNIKSMAQKAWMRALTKLATSLFV